MFQAMADLESHGEAPKGASDDVRAAIEQALVAEAVRIPEKARGPETALAFSRIFNRDAGFSRIFSRGGTQLGDLTVEELAEMEDEAFAKFTKRLRELQDTEPRQAEDR